MAAKKIPPFMRKDMADDRKAGVKEGSAKDQRLDKAAAAKAKPKKGR